MEGMDIGERQLASYIFDAELSEGKMVFVSGPRQVGKTTFARHLLGRHDESLTYYNWDNPLVRKAYRDDPFFFLDDVRKSNKRMIVFDEIHKRKGWKDVLKGIHDSIERDIRLLVTGSARLDMFRQSGDSLVGRYVLFHMFPLSMSEAMQRPLEDLWLAVGKDWKNPLRSLEERLAGTARGREREEIFSHLLHFGGFPEPFVKGSERTLRRWKDEYLTLLLKEDMRDLTGIKMLDTAEHIIQLLPERVGSLLSINALAQDVGVSYPTAKNHLVQLKKLWLLFELLPWSRRINRSLRKGAKWYFTNWIYAMGEGAVFENMVASCLLRASFLWSELAYGRASLWYVRNFDGSEVDFLLALDGRPALLVEAKLGETAVSRSLMFFGGVLNVPRLQLVGKPGIFKKVDGETFLVSADRFLSVIP
jgi:predicted AAA+ superfamily ATPase